MTDQVERYGKMIEIFMQKKLWQAPKLAVWRKILAILESWIPEPID